MAITIAELKQKVMAIDPAGKIERGAVSDVLDLYIILERQDNPYNHADVVAHGKAIIRKFGEQIYATTNDTGMMQMVYYSFTNSMRYLLTPEISYLVRSSLSDAWEGIGDWRV